MRGHCKALWVTVIVLEKYYISAVYLYSCAAGQLILKMLSVLFSGYYLGQRTVNWKTAPAHLTPEDKNWSSNVQFVVLLVCFLAMTTDSAPSTGRAARGGAASWTCSS